MKKILLLVLCLGVFSTTHAQSNKEIANVYIKRARNSIELHIDYKQARVFFQKAMKYMDTITSPDVARLGAFIYFELDEFKEAKKLSKQYFLLNENRKRNLEEYEEQLELAVSIDEKIEIQTAEENRLKAEKLKKEKAKKRLDSLKSEWNKVSDKLTLKVDTIYTFDKNNFAVFKEKGKLGILDDRGQVFVKPSEFTDFITYDGFVLLLNHLDNASKIYCFNTNSKIGFLIPSPSVFNSLSTHYGKVMLPRGNGHLVAYPNNSAKAMVFDLNLRKFLKNIDEQDLLKRLKKEERIGKYNKEGEVKIDKTWYKFGAHLGGGIYTLSVVEDETNSVQFFLCTVDGKLLSAVGDYQYLGAYYNGRYQAMKGTAMKWVNQNGTPVEDAENESGVYKGLSKIVRLDKGRFQIMQNELIVLGKEKLEKLASFLKKHTK